MAQTVTTFAGSGLTDFADGLGTAAAFQYPYSAAIDAAGTIYLADAGSDRIRKITPAGLVTTLAGSTLGAADGTGAAAQFYVPCGVAVNTSGTVFVADRNNHRIRKITPAGVVTTFAGSEQGFADGIGAAAQFSAPSGLAIDAAGVIYVADTGNNRIRKITPSGIVTTFAGSTAGSANGVGTAAQFNYPCAVAVDASGTVFVADTANGLIRKITAQGMVTLLAGSGLNEFTDGIGAAAQFDFPQGVAVDASGNVFVADTNNNRIRKITPNAVVTTVAGSTQGYADGPGSEAKFYGPYGLAIVSAETLLIVDSGNNRIRKILGVLATENVQVENNAFLFPNPASSIINIGLKDIETATATISDLNGRALKTEKILNGSCIINISNFANGIYFIEIDTENGKICKKILKN